MKKFIFRLPLVSLVLGAAIAAVASTGMFKNSHKHAEDTYTFEYVGANADTTSVKDLSNWHYTTSAPSCNNTNVRPCSMEVDASYVDNSGSTPVLNSGFNINTSPSIGGNNYVSSTSDPAATIINRSN